MLQGVESIVGSQEGEGMLDDDGGEKNDRYMRNEGGCADRGGNKLSDALRNHLVVNDR